MDFRVLGPLTVERDGDPVDLGPRKQRALLALLLVDAGQVVPVDRLVEGLWGDDHEGKGNALQVHVSRLRSVLEPDRARGDSSVLETGTGGYRLTVDPDCFDAVRFERAAARGRDLLADDPAAAADVLAAALELWTGDAYEDFAYDDFASFERGRLQELRIGAVEDRIEADLACGRAGELVSELEVLRARHPLRERFVAQQALALYRAGRPADALRAIGRFRRHIGEELGIEPSPDLLRLEERVLLHDDAIQPRRSAADRVRTPRIESPNPFKGLRPFATVDAGAFFGRDALVAELLRTIGSGQRLVGLVGASGSGKSSVVRAGLIPALAKGAIEGSEGWLVANMMPGAHPFAELEAALLRSTLDAPDSLTDQLRGDEGLVRAALRLLPDDAHLLLVIDQFEELFTMVDDDAVRERFLSNLVTAIDDPHHRVTVLVTLRADFYGQPLRHPQFGARLGNGIVNVTALTAEELEAAAMKPAGLAGVALEPALIGRLISDVGSQPGALPLFQYALTELFDRRAGDTLLASTYTAMGGIAGALERRATDLYEQLDPAAQAAARQLFLRLVSVTEADRRSRRRVAAREVASLDVDTVGLHEAIARFGEHRLLSFDSDPLTGAPTVEVAHEALLTEWPILEAWIDESRDDLRRHGALAMALREWELAERNPDYLLTSARLAEYDQWRTASALSLNTAECAFLDAGAARAEAERQAAERRRLDDVRSRRRLWALVALLAAGLGVAGLSLTGVFAPGDDPEVVVYGSFGDSSWTDNVISGVDRAGRKLPMELLTVERVVDPVSELREIAASAPAMIIVPEAETIRDFLTVVAEYPDVPFGIPEAGLSAPNLTTADFSNEEGAFLAGAAAALKSETGIVGFIGAVDVPVIGEFRAGFEAGATWVRPDVTVLATFIDQFDDVDGFMRTDLAADRARALYDRGADVLFAAAGSAGYGVFVAAAEPDAGGRFRWAIGVDNDQWFDVPESQRPHVLTSIVKRGDVAAYRLIEYMLAGGPPGEAFTLGLSDDAFGYSTQNTALTADITGVLDQAMADIVAGRIEMPSDASGPVLVLDREGIEIEEYRGIDGLLMGEPAEPSTYDIAALGTPFSLTLTEEWLPVDNMAGDTRFWDGNESAVIFLRPTLLADPAQPQAEIPLQDLPPADDIEAWLDALDRQIVTVGPERTEIGGRAAIHFEVALEDREHCGDEEYCVGFIVNTIFPIDVISGWSFEPGRRDQVWWVDGGDVEPIVIVVTTPIDDTGPSELVTALLDSIVIGEPRPHPLADG